MTDKQNTGGPAFPLSHSHRELEGTNWQHANGMTLRDYFAANAMQGMLANQHPYQASDEHMFARDAYVLADAMIKQRNQ